MSLASAQICAHRRLVCRSRRTLGSACASRVSGVRPDRYTCVLAGGRSGQRRNCPVRQQIRCGFPSTWGSRIRAEQRIGLLIYPFRMKRVRTRNRPTDEIRGQLRYGSEESWPAEDHFVARDIAGVDTTLLLGVDPQENVIVGLDPAYTIPCRWDQRVRQRPALQTRSASTGGPYGRERTARARGVRLPGLPRGWRHSLASARSGCWITRHLSATRATWAWTRRCATRQPSMPAPRLAHRARRRPGIGWSGAST